MNDQETHMFDGCLSHFHFFIGFIRLLIEPISSTSTSINHKSIKNENHFISTETKQKKNLDDDY